MEYPKKCPFWAMKFGRLRFRACTDLSDKAHRLLELVASTEDSKRYSGPVNFWGDQIMSLLNIRRKETLRKIRQEACDAGWLVYVNSGNRKPGKYYTVIPADVPDFEDTPLGEGVDTYEDGFKEGYRQAKAELEAANERDKQQQSVRSVGLSTSPVTSPVASPNTSPVASPVTSPPPTPSPTPTPKPLRERESNNNTTSTSGHTVAEWNSLSKFVKVWNSEKSLPHVSEQYAYGHLRAWQDLGEIPDSELAGWMANPAAVLEQVQRSKFLWRGPRPVGWFTLRWLLNVKDGFPNLRRLMAGEFVEDYKNEEEFVSGA